MSSNPSCTVYIEIEGESRKSIRQLLLSRCNWHGSPPFSTKFIKKKANVDVWSSGNLDERVSDRVLYDILIQAGRVVDLHIPRDKETDRPKGFAFAEYETEEIADYAVRLFTGLVTLYNRTLRFGISGQDKAAPNLQAPSMLTSNSPLKSRLHEEVATSPLSRYAQVSPGAAQYSNVNRSHVDHNIDDHRRGFGATWDGITHSRSSRYDMSSPKHYAPY